MVKISIAPHEFSGAAAEFPFKLFEKIGVVVKSALETDGCHRDTLPQHVASHHQPFLYDELIESHARVLFKLVA